MVFYTTVFYKHLGYRSAPTQCNVIRRQADVAYGGGCNYDSTAIRPPFDSNSTANNWPLDHLRYDRRPTCVWAAALWPK